MSRLRVSVAMCTFNGERYIAEQLRGIMEQDVLLDEIVLADDGSTDRTLEIVDAARARLQERTRLVVLEPESSPLGVARNFDRALAATTGDVVLLADQDDLWSPTRVGTSLQVFSDDPGVMAHAMDAELIDGAGRRLGRTQFDAMSVTARELRILNSPDAFSALARRNVVPGMSLAVSRGLLREALPVPEAWAHDYFLVTWAGWQGKLRVSPDSSQLEYRQHGTNLVGVRPASVRMRAERALARPGEAALRARQFTELHARLVTADTPMSERGLTLLGQKVEFERARACLPRSGTRRVSAVTRLALSGAYSALASAGLMTALQDMLTPRTPGGCHARQDGA